MESPSEHDDDPFFDALADFPFHDCAVTDQSEPSTSVSTSSVADVSSTATTLRRRKFSGRRIPSTGAKAYGNVDASSITSSITEIDGTKTRDVEKRYKIYRDLKGKEKNLDSAESNRASRGIVDSSRAASVGAVSSVGDENNREESTAATAANDDGIDDSMGDLGDSDSSNLLLFIAGLVIKAIGFQVNLFVYFITFPVWVLYCSYMFVIDPCGAIRRCRECLVQKLGSLWDLINGTFGSLVYDWLKEHKSIGNLFFQCGWGLFWSVYVCIVLCGLLVFSIIISGFFMRYLVEEPIQMVEELNFDYTKNSPVAFVPIMSCDGVTCDGNCEENIKDASPLGSRVIPANHKLQVTVLLTLPESEYNRHLGIFQVRVGFLSADGKTLASKSHPCMLKFKSEPIRVLLTFLEIAPLLAGYISESQTLRLNIKGFTEGDVPTSCLKIIIEQRAEFRPGAGVPEIYDASLVLESELPFLKRVIWSWKTTLFVWISMMSFVMELLFTLICCRSVIIPRSGSRSGPEFNSSVSDNLQSRGDIRTAHQH